MLYLFRLLLLLINIDQETVLNWFELKIVQIKKLVKHWVMILTFQILNHRYFRCYITSNLEGLGKNSGWFNFS
jgi:hypothetical protein